MQFLEENFEKKNDSENFTEKMYAEFLVKFSTEN